MVRLFAILLSCVLAALPAHAAPAQTMIYQIYAGGVHVVQTEMTIAVTGKKTYSIELKADTLGFLHTLVPWTGTFSSKGTVQKSDVLRPSLHVSTATWRGDYEYKKYMYGPNGAFKGLIIEEDGKPPKREEPPKELTQGTTDAFSAALQVMMAVANGKDCKGQDEVFDGKRRFRQVFADQGDAALEKSRYNVYEGKARECTVEVIPVAGEWHKKPRGWLSIQEQGRARGTMPTLWMATMAKGAPAVPVKIRIKTAYGTLFAHLSQYRQGNNIRIADPKTGQ